MGFDWITIGILTVKIKKIYEFVRNLKIQILIFKDFEMILVYAYIHFLLNY